ncbi:MAG: hypothetical protein ACXWC3_27575 [Burkholderiales bacterium]
MLTRLRHSKFVRQLAYSLREPASRGRLIIDAGKLENARVANREFLKTVDCWIREGDYQDSIFQYGLPPRVRHLIDNPMTEELTYSDVISCLARELGENLRYLELGVSVGKNFSQLLHYVDGAELSCFDIEDINPVLETMLVKRSEVEWQTAKDSMRKRPSRLTEYFFAEKNNRVRYLAGDIFDPQSWEHLRGRSYNLIFSDAFHSAKALLHEWEMIKACDLLAPEGFTVLWDDLGNREMRAAFYAIVAEMCRDHGLRRADAGIVFYRGWLGKHEPYHPLGFMRINHYWR